jgi:FAD synthetase
MTGGTGGRMDRVVAQGTFDILHPGHVHYLREAASMGDELHVIVARDENVTHKPSPIIAGSQRVEMVEALAPVDHARLGHPDDIFVPIEELSPSVIALGHDQHHDVAGIEEALTERDIDCDVVRASGREADADEILSTGAIIERIVDRRC